MSDSITFLKLGVSLEELISDYGDPTNDDYFMGGRLVFFNEKIGYFLSQENKVVGFTTADSKISIFDAHVGMTPHEVSSIFSKESTDTFFDTSETQSFVTTYYKEGYEIYFYSDKENSPTTSVILIYKEKWMVFHTQKKIIQF